MVMLLFVGQYAEDSIHCKNGRKGRREGRMIYIFGIKI